MSKIKSKIKMWFAPLITCHSHLTPFSAGRIIRAISKRLPALVAESTAELAPTPTTS